jgi:S-adenosylmethionine:tRNA-ribosyltransferase-isomerase (queuine synthetase)
MNGAKMKNNDSVYKRYSGSIHAATVGLKRFEPGLITRVLLSLIVRLDNDEVVDRLYNSIAYRVNFGQWTADTIKDISIMCRLNFYCDKTGKRYLVKQEERANKRYWYVYGTWKEGKYRGKYLGKTLDFDRLKEKILEYEGKEENKPLLDTNQRPTNEIV